MAVILLTNRKQDRRSALFGDLAPLLQQSENDDRKSTRSTNKKREEVETEYSAFIVWVEPEGDAYFTPEAICIVYPDHVYRVYALSSRHNFLRTAILKHPLADLQEEGIVYRDTSIRLEDLQSFRVRFHLQAANVTLLLQTIYNENPRLYHFLHHYVVSQTEY